MSKEYGFRVTTIGSAKVWVEADSEEEAYAKLRKGDVVCWEQDGDEIDPFGRIILEHVVEHE